MHILPQYNHIINPKLKHIYLSFDDEGTLLIKSPNVSKTHIEKLLLKKASWITKSRKKIEVKKAKNIHFNTTPELYFLGECHHLMLNTYLKKRTKLAFNGDIFTLYYSEYNETTFKKHIDNFYKKEAQNYIPSLVSQWSQRMNLSYNRISFRKTKRQWGSCSARNDLSFNTMMMKLPLNVIEYIVVHELAHIRHKHHQKDFWHLVAQYIPDYKERISLLKQYST